MSRNSPCPCGSGKKYKKCCGFLPASACRVCGLCAPAYEGVFPEVLPGQLVRIEVTPQYMRYRCQQTGIGYWVKEK